MQCHPTSLRHLYFSPELPPQAIAPLPPAAAAGRRLQSAFPGASVTAVPSVGGLLGGQVEGQGWGEGEVGGSSSWQAVSWREEDVPGWSLWVGRLERLTTLALEAQLSSVL